MKHRAFRPVDDSPVGVGLRDVVATPRLVAAVGEDGVIVHRVDGNWRLVDRGVGNGDILHGTAATDDGRRLWWVGGNGSAGYHDVGNEETHEYAIPKGSADFRSVAVAGSAGREAVWVVDDDGVVHHGSPDGNSGWAWSRETPGGGETLYDVVYAPDRPVVTSENGVAYVRRDDGWTSVGIESPDLVDAVAVTSAGRFFGSEDDVYVPVEDGWEAYELSNDTVMDITARGEQVLAATEDGDVHGYTDGEWENFDVDCDAALHAIDGRNTAVAVGDGGMILEFTS